MADDSDDFAVFLHLLEVLVNADLSAIILPTLGGLGECLLLRAVPLVGEMGEGREGKTGQGRVGGGEGKECLKLISTQGMSGVSELPQSAEK